MDEVGVWDEGVVTHSVAEPWLAFVPVLDALVEQVSRRFRNGRERDERRTRACDLRRISLALRR